MPAAGLASSLDSAQGTAQEIHFHHLARQRLLQPLILPL
jgi:hypothetical protein